MTGPIPESLTAQFDALHAERVATWPPEQLARNVGQRQTLVDRFDSQAVAQPGEVLPPFTLTEVDEGALTLDSLVTDGPAVLIFFRFAGCPACNIALPYYDRQLRTALEEAGVPLVAVSPQVPEKLVEIKRRHTLGYRVATDPDGALIKRLGIGFVPDDQPSPPPAGWIGEVTGTGSWELPQASVLIVEPGRTVRWLSVSPDWLRRAEASDILAALALEPARAAA